MLAADSSSSPQRTCVGCRRRGARSVLLRVVAVEDGGHLVAALDERRSRSGRGCWVHPDPVCWELASRRTAFTRALRVSGPLDLEPLIERLQELHQQQDDQQDLAPEKGRGHHTSPSPSASTRATGSGSKR